MVDYCQAEFWPRPFGLRGYKLLYFNSIDDMLGGLNHFRVLSKNIVAKGWNGLISKPS
jgi:hypothetical protein